MDKVFLDTYFSALRFGADVIITRNKQDFANSLIPCEEPAEYLNR